MEDIFKCLKDENEKFDKLNSQFEESKKKFIIPQTLENNLFEIETEYKKEFDSVKNYKEELIQENINHDNLIKKLKELKDQFNDIQSQCQALSLEESSLKNYKVNCQEKTSNSKQIKKLEELSDLIVYFKTFLGINWDFRNIDKQNLCGYIINKKSDYIKYFSGIESTNIEDLLKEIEKASHGEWNQF